jgi:glycosyltransferase involved in cell wall biosynthesis
MKVSIITPTFQRQDRLDVLYETFRRQTHEDTELLVFDDSPAPSAAMQAVNDPRVRYFYSDTRVGIGAKRDWLVRASSGEVIVQFDDDDYYAPHYVERMVHELADCDFVKLGKWFLMATDSGEYFYWDTTVISPLHYQLACGEALRPIVMNPAAEERADWIDRMLWGYGFSYAFRRRVYDVAQFDPAIDRKQDYPFAVACRQAGLRLRAIADEDGLALHVIHDSNTSRSFPNYRVPPFLVAALFGKDAATFCREARARRPAVTL